MWPGATFPYQDKLPSHMQTFDSTVNYFDRVDTVSFLGIKMHKNISYFFFIDNQVDFRSL